MAPRTGADGLIKAPPLKGASARVSLALALAALLALSGCGGGSASETASGPSSSAAASAAAKGAKEKPSGQSPEAARAPREGLAAEEAAKAAPKEEPGAGKRGPRPSAPEGPREPEPTSRERAEATLASMSLTSPALRPGPESTSALPAPYTCDGKDTWPTLKWAGVPPGTDELALLALNLEPVNEALFFDWALAGLDPSLEGLESGRLPKGAIIGRNSFGKEGYSICPSAEKETIIFALYALPKSLGAKKGFDPAALRKRILATSGNTGLLAVTYGRG
jgi:phosphatidylethanolamine-binding protein (PEBP) family uncharacterized protein